MLNRTGFSGKTEVELSLAPWQSIISDIVMDVPDDPFNWDKPIDPGTFRRRVFDPACIRAGVGKVRLHDLRHTCGSLSLTAVMSLFAVSRRLGHSSPDFTARVYGHEYRSSAQTDAEALSAFCTAEAPASLGCSREWSGEDCRLAQSGQQAPGCARRPPRATTGLGYDHGAMTADLANWPAAEQRIAELARTRRGRHRNTALASWRKTRAVELRATGMSYAQIAAEVGYANRGTVHSVVIQALQAREAESVDLLRQVELERLDAVHAALWPKAMAGDVDAVMALLRIIEARCRLLGLYGDRGRKESADRWDSCQGPATVVVRADDCRHQGCERHGRFPVHPSAQAPGQDN